MSRYPNTTIFTVPETINDSYVAAIDDVVKVYKTKTVEEERLAHMEPATERGGGDINVFLLHHGPKPKVEPAKDAIINFLPLAGLSWMDRDELLKFPNRRLLIAPGNHLFRLQCAR
eukprot:sb/3476653/